MHPQIQASPLDPAQLPLVLRGEVSAIRRWILDARLLRTLFHVGFILVGTAAFGFVVGAWRDPLQGAYTALKFPVIVLLTALGNGVLNGLLAPLLGINISIRQSLLAILMSFTIAAAVLGACAPVLYFVIWNMPAFSATRDATAFTMHSFFFVALAATMAGAGIAGNLRLFKLLQSLGGSRQAALGTLLAWLGGNLLLGSQLAWILRPFVGAPHLPVEFVRRNALEGNFFEALFRHIQQLLN